MLDKILDYHQSILHLSALILIFACFRSLVVYRAMRKAIDLTSTAQQERSSLIYEARREATFFGQDREEYQYNKVVYRILESYINSPFILFFMFHKWTFDQFYPDLEYRLEETVRFLEQSDRPTYDLRKYEKAIEKLGL